MFIVPKAAALPLWAIAGLQLLAVAGLGAPQAQTPAIAPTGLTARTAPTAPTAPTASTATTAQTATTAPTAPRVPAGTPADPGDAKAPVPASAYVSPLRAYRGSAEPTVAPWRETNDVVRQRGGWRSYARHAGEAGLPQPPVRDASLPAPAPAAMPASGGHSGHSMQ
jgi:hypothetical protein